MNANNNWVNLKFTPETRFAVKTATEAPFRVAQESDFERLKNRLLNRELQLLERPDLNTAVRRAANEAAALAWVTFHPVLVFPALFEEKVAATVRQAERQARIYAQSREIYAA